MLIVNSLLPRLQFTINRQQALHSNSNTFSITFVTYSNLLTASLFSPALASSAVDSDRSKSLPSDGQCHALIRSLRDSDALAVSGLVERRGGLLEVELGSTDLVVGAHVGAATGRDGTDGSATAGGLLVGVDDGRAGGGQEGGCEGEELHDGKRGIVKTSFVLCSFAKSLR